MMERRGDFKNLPGEGKPLEDDLGIGMAGDGHDRLQARLVHQARQELEAIHGGSEREKFKSEVRDFRQRVVDATNAGKMTGHERQRLQAWHSRLVGWRKSITDAETISALGTNTPIMPLMAVDVAFEDEVKRARRAR